ncbi:MAG: radical SAM protein [Nanoarchaeota archaeon]|nr:radical SAM protein [Nanoarchaeota archaeon]MBU1051181.1 radical SAM protein [Nanoarchaeota archaeon]MBU1988694.1 radical SAM protein [Nanoarchaeota archaeon]
MVEFNVDNHKLMLHPERVAEWGERGDCFPVYVEIGPTSACNHRCVFCALDFTGYEGKFIDRKVMIQTLEDMAQAGVKSTMFAGEGEPLLHKDIGLFTQTAKQSGLDVSMTTNGVPLVKKKMEECLPHLSWIRFSIDSGSPENYAEVHKTNPRDFEKVMANIQGVVRYKETQGLRTTIGTQFLVIPQNMGEVTKLARRLKDIGADNIQIKPYSQHPTSINSLCVNPGEYNQLEEQLLDFDSPEFRVLFRRATAERIQSGIPYGQCHGLPFSALIDTKGNVMPCNLFYDKPEFIYGNLNKQRFPEIWQGNQRKEVIQKLNEIGCEDCRAGCRLDPINRYLDRLKNPQDHDNFV